MSVRLLARNIGPHWAVVLFFLLATGTFYGVLWSRTASSVISADGGSKAVGDAYSISLFWLFLPSVGILAFDDEMSRSIHVFAEIALVVYLIVLTITAFRVARALETHLASKYGSRIRFNWFALCLYNFAYISFWLDVVARRETGLGSNKS